MRLIVFVFALSASFVGMTVEGWAGAYGSSILNVSNLRLQYKSSGVWVDATAAQATIVNTTITSRSSATLGGSNITSPLASGFNANQSFVSSTMPAPTPQTSALVNLGSSPTNSFAYGDTWGVNGATLISTGGVRSSTLAEVNALGAISGAAFGNVGGTSIFEVEIFQGGVYRLAFDADLKMQSTVDGYATNTFRVQVNQSPSTFPPPDPPPSINYADSALNRSISGNNLVNVSTSFLSPEFTLEDYMSGASNVTFNITQTSIAGATVIPEPSSMAIFGLMSVGSLVAWRRRRGGERKSAEA